MNLIKYDNEYLSFSIHPDTYKQDPGYTQTKSHETDTNAYKQPLRPLDSNTNLGGHPGYHQPPDTGLAGVSVKTEQPDYSKQYNYSGHRWKRQLQLTDRMSGI